MLGLDAHTDSLQGKTRVIIEAIKLLKLHWEVPFPILVCAHTNVAVDNLLEGLNDHGVKAVRLGATERVRPSLMDLNLDLKLAEHPLYDEVEALQRAKDEPFQQPGDGSSKLYSLDVALRLIVNTVAPTDWRRIMAKKGEIDQKFYGKRSRMLQEVLADADVVS